MARQRRFRLVDAQTQIGDADHVVRFICGKPVRFGIANEFLNRKSFQEQALAKCFRGDALPRKHLQAFARISRAIIDPQAAPSILACAAGSNYLVVFRRRPATICQTSFASGAFHEAALAREKLNLLQPAFVLSVGDFIEGGQGAGRHPRAEWKEFDGLPAKYATAAKSELRATIQAGKNEIVLELKQ